MKLEKGQIVKVATAVIMPQRQNDSRYQWQYGVIEQISKDKQGNTIVNVTYGNIKGKIDGKFEDSYVKKVNKWFWSYHVKSINTEESLRSKELSNFARLFELEFKCKGE
jgi:hypothetical protein